MCNRTDGAGDEEIPEMMVQCMHTYISINSLNPSNTHHPLTNPLIITLFYIHPTKGPKHKKKIPMYPKHPR